MAPVPAARSFQEISRLLNDARQRRQLSIRAAANLAGVPTATAQGWLNGRHQPTPALRANFFQLVEALGLADVVDEEWWMESAYSRVAPHLRDGHPPYLGLRPYSADDFTLFFGRGQAVAELASAVTGAAAGPAPRIVALVGASGTGKSSLLAAGLAQALQPGQPLAGQRLRQAPVATLATADPAAFSAEDIVVADQFEDVFHLAPGDRADVLRVLESVASTATVVIGLRADVFAEASLEPVLAPALSRPVLLAPLTAEELKQAITEPALSQQVVVEDELLTVLLNDLATGAGTRIAPAVLPLVSTALLFTWAAGTGSRMTLGDYLSVGGVGSAIEQLADGVLASLTPEQRQLTEQLFLRLVSIEADSISISSLPLASLDAAIREVVDAFANARLLTLTQSDVRISHEALLRHWPRLSEWIENGREKLFVLQQLKRAAQQWLDDGRDPESLLSAGRLPLFQALVEEEPDPGPLLTADERAFVTASADKVGGLLEKERRTSFRLRRRGRIALTSAAVAVALALIAGVLYVQAQTARVASAAAESAAQSRQVALAAQQASTEDPNLQVRLALVADALSTTAEARSALGDATSVNAPLRWAGTGPAVLAVSPDQLVVVRADGAGRVTIWRGDELVRKPGTSFDANSSGDPVAAIAIAQAGGRTVLAVAGEAGASIWDITAGPTRLAELEGTGWSAVAITPSADRVAFGNRDGDISLVGLTGSIDVGSTAQLPRESPGERVSVRSVVFDRDGRTLFVGGKASTILRWQVAASRLTPLTPIRYDNVRPVASLALSPSGDELVAGLLSRRILRWRVHGDTFTPLTDIDGFASFVNDVEFSPDGKRLLAASEDNGTYLFDSESGRQQRRLNGPNAVDSVGLAVGGRVVTADARGDLRVWPTQDPLLRSDAGAGHRFAVDRSGRWLALATAFDGVALWDTSGDNFTRLPSPSVALAPKPDGTAEALAAGVAVDPAGRFLLAGTDGGNVVSWPLTDGGAGRPAMVSAVPGQDIGFLAVNPAGDLVAAVPVNGGSEVALLRVDAEGRLTRVGDIPTQSPHGAAFSPDGRLLAVPRGPAQVELWSMTDPGHPSLAATVELASQPSIVAFAPDAPQLAIGELSGEVAIFDLANPAAPYERGRYRDPRSRISGLAWSPDRAWLLASAGDGHVWQWDATKPNSTAVASYSGGLGQANDVSYVHAGGQFVATGETGEVRVWIAGHEDARRHLCASQGSPLSDAERADWLRGVPALDPCRGVA